MKIKTDSTLYHFLDNYCFDAKPENSCELGWVMLKSILFLMVVVAIAGIALVAPIVAIPMFVLEGLDVFREDRGPWFGFLVMLTVTEILIMLAWLIAMGWDKIANRKNISVPKEPSVFGEWLHAFKNKYCIRIDYD